jgi:hypothetical protein
MSYGTILILSAYYIKRYLEQSVNSNSENRCTSEDVDEERNPNFQIVNDFVELCLLLQRERDKTVLKRREKACSNGSPSDCVVLVILGVQLRVRAGHAAIVPRVFRGQCRSVLVNFFPREVITKSRARFTILGVLYSKQHSTSINW